MGTLPHLILPLVYRPRLKTMWPMQYTVQASSYDEQIAAIIDYTLAPSLALLNIGDRYVVDVLDFCDDDAIDTFDFGVEQFWFTKLDLWKNGKLNIRHYGADGVLQNNNGFDPNTFPDPKITLSVKYPSWEHNKVITLGLLARDLVNPVTGTPELYNRYNVDFQQ